MQRITFYMMVGVEIVLIKTVGHDGNLLRREFVNSHELFGVAPRDRHHGIRRPED